MATLGCENKATWAQPEALLTWQWELDPSAINHEPYCKWGLAWRMLVCLQVNLSRNLVGTETSGSRNTSWLWEPLMPVCAQDSTRQARPTAVPPTLFRISIWSCLVPTLTPPKTLGVACCTHMDSELISFPTGNGGEQFLTGKKSSFWLRFPRAEASFQLGEVRLFFGIVAGCFSHVNWTKIRVPSLTRHLLLGSTHSLWTPPFLPNPVFV